MTGSGARSGHDEAFLRPPLGSSGRRFRRFRNGGESGGTRGSANAVCLRGAVAAECRESVDCVAQVASHPRQSLNAVR